MAARMELFFPDPNGGINWPRTISVEIRRHRYQLHDMVPSWHK